MIHLESRVGNNLENRKEDIFQVKRVFEHLGLFDFSSKPEPHGYITRSLDEAIKTYQKNNALRIDGKMYPKGETEKHLNTHFKRISENDGLMPAVPPSSVEREVLPPPRKLIHGTNIPDRGVPEQGFPIPKDDYYYNRQSLPVYQMDKGILAQKIPSPDIDPNIFTDYNLKEPNFTRRLR